MFCPKCGKVLSDTARFCGNCGHKLKVSGNRKQTDVETNKSIIAALGCCICFIILVYFAVFHIPKSDWCYSDISGGEATIKEYNGKESAIVIPETVKVGWFSYDVTEIGSDAFKGCSSLKSIEIPGSVTEIGWGAFEGCSSLTNIKISEGVTEISLRAFAGCSSLTSIELPNGVTRIDDEAFKECSRLTSIEIPGSVTRIGSGAFKGCSSLTSIEIPDSVTFIANTAFEGCSNLTGTGEPISEAETDAETTGSGTQTETETSGGGIRITDDPFSGLGW